MSDAGGLTSCIRREASCATKRSSGSHCVTSGRARRHHAQFTVRPSSSTPYRLLGSAVTRYLLDEQVQDVFGTTRSPQGKKAVSVLGKRPATPDCDHPRVTDRRQNHARIISARFEGNSFTAATAQSGCDSVGRSPLGGMGGRNPLSGTVGR